MIAKVEISTTQIVVVVEIIGAMMMIVEISREEMEITIENRITDGVIEMITGMTTIPNNSNRKIRKPMICNKIMKAIDSLIINNQRRLPAHSEMNKVH